MNDLVENDFRILIQLKVKHADLLEAARKIGGIKKLADHIGIQYTTVWGWIALKNMPNLSSKNPRNSFYDPERRAKIEAKLFELTGKLLEELWPESIRSSDFLDAPKTAEIIQHTSFKSLFDIRPDTLLLPSPEEELEAKQTIEEQEVAIEKILKTLSSTEREILRLRFGLTNDSRSYTLEEIGKIFKITKERVRCIESRALKRFKHRIDNNSQLYEVLGANDAENKQAEREEKESQS